MILRKLSNVLKVSGFTLVELLLVVGIMGVLMGISLPAFTKMAKGNGVTIASRNIAAKINACRSYAVTKRAYVALAFPSCNDTGVPTVLRYVSYRPAIVSYDGSTCVFVNWVDGENWEKMPTGTIFNCTSSATATGTLVDNQTPVTVCNFQDVNTSASTATISNCIVFKPSGGTINASAFGVGIWEATVTSYSSTTPTITQTNSSNHVTLSVNPFTGRISYSNLGQ